MLINRVLSAAISRRGIAEHDQADDLPVADGEVVRQDQLVGEVGLVVLAVVPAASAGTLRPDLDPGDVVLALAGLWQLDPATDWRAQAQRIYDIVLGGLMPPRP